MRWQYWLLMMTTTAEGEGCPIQPAPEELREKRQVERGAGRNRKKEQREKGGGKKQREGQGVKEQRGGRC